MASVDARQVGNRIAHVRGVELDLRVVVHERRLVIAARERIEQLTDDLHVLPGHPRRVYAERMPMKVVPAGDERCDIHNKRTPAQYICESCVQDLGVEKTRRRTSRRPVSRRVRRRVRRWRSETDWRVIAGVAAAIVVLVVVLTGILSGGGGGGSSGPSESDVVKALGLARGPSGTWLTADGDCEIVSIDTGPEVTPGPVAAGTNLVIEVANESRTVGAVVITHGTALTEAQCAAHVGDALRAHF